MGYSNIKVITFALAILFSLNFVMALGVSSPYWKDNALEMYPGQIKDVEFTLTNSPTAETTTAIVSLTENAGIAEIISGTDYSVAPGSTNTKVILKISMPKTAAIGDTYNVKFSVKSAPSEGEGTVQLTMTYNVDFPVKVIEKSQAATDEEDLEKESAETNWILWGIIILAILAIGYFLIKKKKR